MKSGLYSYLTGTKQVKTMIRLDSLKAKRILMGDPKAFEVYQKIIAEEPLFSGKTEKIKVALAFYLKCSVLSEREKLKELLRLIGVNESYFRGVLSSVPYPVKCELIERTSQLFKA
ncbi:hypothetical protein HS1genome_0087 [Sulfodiicoccus acidiphilus]|uniref:Uncharacterized protein n=2 Tax=Sulfodiicoccus acidiphilus TaxID=1670455 RepID=A0A348B0J6_9CREN|nr:hypothetical protein HS1genome_0087 [Sulfodiicoccus acidiphilus]GGT86524.1 hypothetical protein GCM10007116_00590 [Sulfodiicoccus acidiphilus]